jgi:hypothetical protein
MINRSDGISPNARHQPIQNAPNFGSVAARNVPSAVPGVNSISPFACIGREDDDLGSLDDSLDSPDGIVPSFGMANGARPPTFGSEVVPSLSRPVIFDDNKEERAELRLELKTLLADKVVKWSDCHGCLRLWLQRMRVSLDAAGPRLRSTFDQIYQQAFAAYQQYLKSTRSAESFQPTLSLPPLHAAAEVRMRKWTSGILAADIQADLEEEGQISVICHVYALLVEIGPGGSNEEKELLASVVKMNPQQTAQSALREFRVWKRSMSRIFELGLPTPHIRFLMEGSTSIFSRVPFAAERSLLIQMSSIRLNLTNSPTMPSLVQHLSLLYSETLLLHRQSRRGHLAKGSDKPDTRKALPAGGITPAVGDKKVSFDDKKKELEKKQADAKKKADDTKKKSDEKKKGEDGKKPNENKNKGEQSKDAENKNKNKNKETSDSKQKQDGKEKDKSKTDSKDGSNRERVTPDCLNFKNQGSCRFGDKCRFVHPGTAAAVAAPAAVDPAATPGFQRPSQLLPTQQ